MSCCKNHSREGGGNVPGGFFFGMKFCECVFVCVLGGGSFEALISIFSFKIYIKPCNAAKTTPRKGDILGGFFQTCQQTNSIVHFLTRNTSTFVKLGSHILFVAYKTFVDKGYLYIIFPLKNPKGNCH